MFKKCPFLSRISEKFLNKCGDSFGHYSNLCPVMNPILSKINLTNITRSYQTSSEWNENIAIEPEVKKCPLRKLINGFQATFDSIYGCNVGSLNNIEKNITSNRHESIKEDFIANDSLDSNTNIKNDLFNYESYFEERINEKINDNSYRTFRRISRSADDFPMGMSSQTGLPIDKTLEKHDNVTVWCSNDYLAMSRHPKVIDTAKSTIDSFGVGSGGTRNISGNSLFHEKLEDELASWYKKDSGLLFTSCYVANDTVLYTLAKMLPNCVVLSDKGNHASMIQGIRNSAVEKIIYDHNNLVDLEKYLSKIDPSRPKIIAFESVNSMNGSISNISGVCQLAQKYGALTFLDEVHAVGLYGHNGSGMAELQNCLHTVDIISGTLGKTIGAIGGFIVGQKKVVDAMRSYGSGFIFTTSLPPLICSSAIESINILKSDEGRNLRYQQKENVQYLRQLLADYGLPITPSYSHIITIHVGDAKSCHLISEHLLNKNKIYVQAINYPTVPRGSERLRIAPTPFHTKQMSQELVLKLVDSWKATSNLELLSSCCQNNKNCSRQGSSCYLLNRWKNLVLNEQYTIA